MICLLIPQPYLKTPFSIVIDVLIRPQYVKEIQPCIILEYSLDFGALPEKPHQYTLVRVTQFVWEPIQQQNDIQELRVII